MARGSYSFPSFSNRSGQVHLLGVELGGQPSEVALSSRSRAGLWDGDVHPGQELVEDLLALFLFLLDSFSRVMFFRIISAGRPCSPPGPPTARRRRRPREDQLLHSRIAMR